MKFSAHSNANCQLEPFQCYIRRVLGQPLLGPQMQGPRLLSHRAESFIKVQRPGEADYADVDHGKQSDVEIERERPEVTPGLKSVKAKKPRLRGAVEWCRRHMRFIGPGLIASAA